MDTNIKTYKYKFVGKSLHPDKQKDIFNLCNAFMNEPSSMKPQTVDWQILGEQCGFITVMNNHTYETFECEILDI